MQNPISISAVIITFNEERNIERCLRSLQGIADEMVVVDSFSGDRTEEICRSFGASFLKRAFTDYSDQKQWAAEQAHFDHILSLDADEALSETLRESILSVKNNWQADGYTFNRLTNYCGRWIYHCGWYPDAKLRLWNRNQGRWNGLKIHESVEMKPQATVAHLKGDLLHYSYYSIQQHRQQIIKFTDMAAGELAEKGVTASVAEAVIKSAWKFVRDYFFKLGFLDGSAGFTISRLSAYATYLKYRKIIFLQKSNR